LNDTALWEKKAMAFVIRSHRHLWGKNNEDPLAFVFKCGLENQFVKDLVIGWNKFGQKRLAENWGFRTDSLKAQKLFFPSGMVIPYIVEKKLLSIFIQPYDENKDNKIIVLNGSSSSTMVLGNRLKKKIERIAFVNNLLDGLFLFQEIKKSSCVMIHPDPDIPLDNHYKTLIKEAETAFIFSGDATQKALNRQIFSDMRNNCFYCYQSKEELRDLFLSS
jgi:hypothetical protein